VEYLKQGLFFSNCRIFIISRSAQRICSQHKDACSPFSDDDLTDETLSGRESVASSCLETELEFEHFQESLENAKQGNNARTLYLQACECMGVVPIKRLLHQLCSDEIRITHRNLNDTDCKAISNALLVNKTVTTLDLSNNLITDKGALYLASAMVERDLVRVLVLAGNKLAYNSAEIFAELLQRSKSLAVLDLSGNKIDDKACVVLAEALKSNKTLQECNLSHNKLSENAGIALAEALTYNTTLQRLNLSWNLIRHGVVSIATALSTNQTLRIFDLSWNGVDDLGIRALVGGLETNTALEELNLSRNNISDSGFLELVKVLETCRLQKLDISRNKCFGLNEALEMLLRLLQEEKTELKIVNIGNALGSLLYEVRLA
jgi:Ran GTPase-activating protein (RanGAP) involved in mRNA processing and transport